MHEHASVKRSLVKSITWRILASLATVVVVYLISGDVKAAISIGGIDVVLKFILYFVHERVWDHTEWGREVVEDSE